MGVASFHVTGSPPIYQEREQVIESRVDLLVVGFSLRLVRHHL
jgi:hypothetical protein